MALTQEMPSLSASNLGRTLSLPASRKSKVLHDRTTILPKTPPPRISTSHNIFNFDTPSASASSSSSQRLTIITTNLDIITPPSTPPLQLQLQPPPFPSSRTPTLDINSNHTLKHNNTPSLKTKHIHKNKRTNRTILTRLETSTAAALSFTTTTLLTLTARIAAVDEALQLYHDTVCINNKNSAGASQITPPTSPTDLEFKNGLVRDIIRREDGVTGGMFVSAERMMVQAEYRLYRDVSEAEGYEEMMMTLPVVVALPDSSSSSATITTTTTAAAAAAANGGDDDDEEEEKCEMGEVKRRIRRLEAVQRIVSLAAMEMGCLNSHHHHNVERVGGFEEGRREMVKVLGMVLEELIGFMRSAKVKGGELPVGGRVELDVGVLKVRMGQLVRFGDLVPGILGMMGYH
ncbi:hypothetical protein AA313_de0208601 [Arthrobotrys entomopaga]|nr:hypothetical protein AA313_de0208601 [Arthrobotrys entomopaga]